MVSPQPKRCAISSPKILLMIATTAATIAELATARRDERSFEVGPRGRNSRSPCHRSRSRSCSRSPSQPRGDGFPSTKPIYRCANINIPPINTSVAATAAHQRGDTIVRIGGPSTEGVAAAAALATEADLACALVVPLKLAMFGL
jgi:hypothetical protein